MKSSQRKKYFSVVILSFSIFTCACATKQQIPIPDSQAFQKYSAQNQLPKKLHKEQKNEGSNDSSLSGDQTKTVEIVPAPSLGSDDSNPLLHNSFEVTYFDFNSSSLVEQARKTVAKNFEQMNNGTSAEYIIEGYCDEIGSAEYNLALGERRAVNVQKYLVTLGFPAERLRFVSYGIEHPADPNHNEAAWAKNRRVEVKKKKVE